MPRKIEPFRYESDWTLTRRVVLDPYSTIPEHYLFAQLLWPTQVSSDGERLDRLREQEAIDFEKFYTEISNETGLHPTNKLLSGSLTRKNQTYKVLMAHKEQYRNVQKQIVIALPDQSEVFVFGEHVHRYRKVAPQHYQQVAEYKGFEGRVFMQQFSNTPLFEAA